MVQVWSYRVGNGVGMYYRVSIGEWVYRAWVGCKLFALPFPDFARLVQILPPSSQHSLASIDWSNKRFFVYIIEVLKDCHC